MQSYIKITYAYKKLLLIALAGVIILFIPLTLLLIRRGPFPIGPTRTDDLSTAPQLSPLPTRSITDVDQEDESQADLTPQPTLSAEELKKLGEQKPPEIPDELWAEIEKVLRGEAP